MNTDAYVVHGSWYVRLGQLTGSGFELADTPKVRRFIGEALGSPDLRIVAELPEGCREFQMEAET